jgi:hypothetical protein
MSASMGLVSAMRWCEWLLRVATSRWPTERGSVRERLDPANSGRCGPYADCLKAAIGLSYDLALWHPLPRATLHNFLMYQLVSMACPTKDKHPLSPVKGAPH